MFLSCGLWPYALWLIINIFFCIGNILVASAYHNKIELLSEKGDHLRTFKLPKLSNPIGLCLRNRFLGIVNGENKTLQVFAVAEQE